MGVKGFNIERWQLAYVDLDHTKIDKFAFRIY